MEANRPNGGARLVCNACRGEFTVARRPLGDGTDLLACPECGLEVRSPMLSESDRHDRYDGPGYFSKDDDSLPGLYGYKNYLKDRYLLMWLLTERLDEIEELVPVGRLLDIGCATGVLLDVARLRGWEVQGVDLSSFAAKIAREYYNLDVFRGELPQAGFPDDHFDVVTMDDFIEHVTDPREVLTEAARILRPGGLMAVGTPNCESLTARLMGRQWFHYKQEEHFFFFTRRSLERLLEDVGLEVVLYRRAARFVDLKFLFHRLEYYYPKVSQWLLRMSQRSLLTRIGFFIHTGEMRIYARKKKA